MISVLQTARLLAPLMVLALILPALGPAVAHLCREEAPVTACCKDRCSMKHAPRPAADHAEHAHAGDPAARQPVAKPCCTPAFETPAPAPTTSPVKDQLVAAVSLLPAEVTAALRVPPPAPTPPDATPPPLHLRSHLAVSVLLI